ncbi:hypothetical protein RRF68_10495 [Tenacibaculum sp. HL-MS23]|uniref:hypothetical protein n=1 Tax=Tenacibaculum TaxID=104267 RepID=UPI0023AF27FD|nr:MULTISPECIES: hypothetical protein [Tenacibaculum]WNW01414.1 hypothetical protein RRF68_10495 [Tenacibaculum sp. HL-MS23]
MKSRASNLVVERGILTSAYKQEIRANINSMKIESLFRIKNKLRSSSTNLYSETATILKVAMFVVALVVIVF